MTTLLLSAGNATRLGERAPGGCKAMTEVGGRTIIDWWSDVDPGLQVVCRREHAGVLPTAANPVYCDDGGGAAVAVKAALPTEGPVTVVYADTWLPSWQVPKGVDWCAVAAASGGRKWDVVEDGLVAYRDVEPGEAALVCIGLYRFADVDRLEWALQEAIGMAQFFGGGEAGMADVVNAYGCTFRPVVGWQDVGDPRALSQWKALA